MHLYRIRFKHFSKKSNQEGILTYIVAPNDEAVFDWLQITPLNPDAKSSHDIFFSNSYEDRKEDTDYETWKARTIKYQGDLYDPDASHIDIYYGYTLFGWECVYENITDDQINILVETDVVKFVHSSTKPFKLEIGADYYLKKSNKNTYTFLGYHDIHDTFGRVTHTNMAIFLIGHNNDTLLTFHESPEQTANVLTMSNTIPLKYREPDTFKTILENLKNDNTYYPKHVFTLKQLTPQHLNNFYEELATHLKLNRDPKTGVFSIPSETQHIFIDDMLASPFITGDPDNYTFTYLYIGTNSFDDIIVIYNDNESVEKSCLLHELHQYIETPLLYAEANDDPSIRAYTGESPYINL